jgi:hypothetical protein
MKEISYFGEFHGKLILWVNLIAKNRESKSNNASTSEQSANYANNQKQNETGAIRKKILNWTLSTDKFYGFLLAKCALFRQISCDHLTVEKGRNW